MPETAEHTPERQTRAEATPLLTVGARVKFRAEKGAYTVKARNERYAICTKPFNPRRTVIYTIVDFKRGVRGTNNLVFNVYDYAEQADVDCCLLDLEKGEVEVSYRNCVTLDIDGVTPASAIRARSAEGEGE